MAKHEVIALNRHNGKISIGGILETTFLKLPKGCTGICFCFESKKAAREYWGKNVNMVRVETDVEDKK